MAVGDVKELYAYRGASQRDGVDTLTRGFSVEGQGVDVARANPGIPRYRDEHPDNPGLLARDFNASPRGADSLVTVSYSPEAYVGGTVPPVNQYAEGFVGVDTTFEDTTVDIPLFERNKVTFGEGDAAVEKLVYQRRDDVMPYGYSRSVIRVPISITLTTSGNFNVAVALGSVISAQINKLHTINGKTYLFKPEGLTQRGSNEFVGTYRWYSDPGVPNVLSVPFGGVQPAPNLIWGRGLTTLYPFFDEDFIIPPFNGVRIDGDQDPEQAPHVTFFERFEREPNGWQTLPGIA